MTDQPNEHDEPKAEQVFGEEATEATETVDAEVVKDKSEKRNLGDEAARFVADAGYAAAGFAGLVGEKVRAFYDEQKAEYVKTHPDTDAPGARQFLEQLGTHLNRLVEDINKGFRDLSDKGREVVDRWEKPAEAQPKGESQAAEDPKPEE